MSPKWRTAPPDIRRQRSLLEIYDPDLALQWSRRVAAPSTEVLVSADGTAWLLDREGATALGDDGRCATRVEVRVPAGMHVSAFAPIDDDLLFACHHIHASFRAPILQRVAKDGRVIWLTTLPVEPIAYDGIVQASVGEGWKPRPMDPWTPTTWRSRRKTLDVSGDAVLACFSDMPRSGIGIGYVLSLAEGALRFTTKQGPLSEAAPLGDGAFLVGYQGYGAFETLRYERDGKAHTRWASHGYYLVTEADVRVVEMANVLPSKMHLARLLPNGAVVQGARLDGYQTSRPCQRRDGTALFVRDGALLAARDLAIDERLQLWAADDRLSSTPVLTNGQSAYLAFTKASSAGGSSQLVRADPEGAVSP